MKILFQPMQTLCEAAEGETLLQTAQRVGVLMDGSCGGNGSCGKCRVRIISGECSPLAPEEERGFTEEELRQGWRLACRVKPQDDLVVELPGSHGGSTRKKNMAKLPEGFHIDPPLKKVFLWVEKAGIENQKSDLTRLLEALGEENTTLDHHLLPGLYKTLKQSRNGVTAAVSNGRILALEAGDTTDACYGLAVDIGTTTAVGMLWDLSCGKNIAVAARTNPQSMYGADVVSRIQFCNEQEGNLAKMQRKVVDCINDMLEELCRSAEIAPSGIYDVTVVGNTTMSHLFLGVDPKPLARMPFAPVFCTAQDRTAAELGLKVSPRANVRVLPNIAGHVGSDITAVLLATELKQREKTAVAIDVGTNGEILLTHRGKVLACSTAAGPAFEGAEIEMGMRAAAGAIEGVELRDGDIAIRTIEDAPPIGICGSGLIDAIACLLDAKVIDPAGRMLTKPLAEAAGLAPRLMDRIQDHKGKPAFLLADGERPILLTQDDVRQVQLAKGAIRAGITTMLRQLGLTEDDLESVLLAGAFGSYINKRSALRIGLLPAVGENRVISVGNAAGVGACMALLSREHRRLADKLAAETEHVELSCSEVFQDEYIVAMGFPHHE